MASFTDTQPPRFNPYIQQQPVEAMVAVGTQKQKAHDEGVQKIQTQIDNLASIDVGRDVDKAYLQSKINELGNNLRTVASGDFSNFQMVNSVGGMIKQIGYDPYIRTAVASTANDRKETALMDEDRKAGKLTPQAEHFYGLKRSKYYNNSSLKGEDGKPVGFGGKYIQSWDIDKNIVEAIKGVGDSKWSADNVFKMVNGQIAKDSNGAPIYSEYAIREIREGKFSENVAAAIDSVMMRPEATQELTMRGVYNYRGYNDINDFVKKYETEKNKAVTNLEAKKFEMMEKVANSTNKEEKAQYQSAVNAIDSRIETTKQEAELKESQAQEFGSVEGYKAALETLKVRNNYMKSGVTEQIRTEIIENIPYKAQQQKIKDERDWWSQKDASARGWASNAIAERAQTLSETKWAQDPKNIKNILGTGEAVLPLGVGFTTQYGQLMDAASAADANMEQTKFNIVSEYMSAINFGNGKALSQADIEKSIKSFEKKAPGFIDRMYGRAKGVSENPALARSPLYSKLMSALPTAAMAETEVGRLGSITHNMNNDGGVIAAGSKQVDLAAIEKGFKPFELTYATEQDQTGTLFGGTRGLFQAPQMTKKTVSAQDAMDLAIIAKNTGGVHGILKTIFNTPGEKAQYESADARIKNKFGIEGRKLLEQTNQLGSQPVFGMATIPKAHPSMQKVFNTVNTQQFDNVMKAKEDYLTKNALIPQPLAYNVYDVNMKGPERTSIDDRVKGVLDKYKVAGGIEAFNNLYTDPKNYSAQIQVERGSTFAPKEGFSLNLYDANGIVKSLPISKGDAEYIKNYKINLPAQASETLQRIQTGKGTTNSTGLPPNHPDAYRGAMVPNTYFMNKLNTTKLLGADVVASPAGGYNAYLYTTDPRTGSRMGVPVKRNKDDIQPAHFDTADKATEYLVTKIDSKAYAESLINTGL